ncbi:MAG: lytic murein transglycosylase [Desulfobulbaceae bacterium]|jgi:membrane-bound lytic murein transglycosylase B|nr:lytic murein transglycosylase [Desulfobulbaceae bacterium]
MCTNEPLGKPTYFSFPIFGHAMNLRISFTALFATTVLMFFVPAPAGAEAASSFAQWVKEFAAQAEANGISRSFYFSVFEGVTQEDANVLEKAAYQPEFKTPLWEYLDTRINSLSVRAGLEKKARYHETLQVIEKRYGVAQEVLLAIWAIETKYGEVLRNNKRLHYLPQALATLAWGDHSRATFARRQLLAALKIMRDDKIGQDKMYGSWAGAMGQTQFIPTSYLTYAVDEDGDGRRDIWDSVADALASSANLLSKNGWRRGESWGIEVAVNTSLVARNGESKTLSAWRKIGLTKADGSALPDSQAMAMLKLPAGLDGPAFLLLPNFAALKHYNNSDTYALAVLLLSDQLAGRPSPKTPWRKPPDALTFLERREMQQLLSTRGLYHGEVDGSFGDESRAALQSFEQQRGLPVTGRPTQNLLNALRRQ